MLKKPRYEIRKVPDKLEWYLFDTFTQKPAVLLNQQETLTTLTEAARMQFQYNRAYETWDGLRLQKLVGVE